MAKSDLARYIQTLRIDLGDFRYNFDKRLEIQKKFYLLEEAGADLGYHFSWYIHGPYSTSLASDTYSLASVTDFNSFVGDLNQGALRKLRGLITSIQKLSSPAKQQSYWLELLSCVHYVMKHSYPTAKSRKEAINAIVSLKGTKFSEQDIGKAYRLLHKFKLL
jgi:uncharacterized protein YwgA